MISHPNRHPNDNDDTDCGTSEWESTLIALAQADRLCLCVTLYLSEKLIGQSGKATHAGAVQLILWKHVAGMFVSPVLMVTADKNWPEIDQMGAEKLGRIAGKQRLPGGEGALLPLTPLVPGYACKGFWGWLIIACALFCAVSETATGWRVCFKGP